ncbi:HAD family hydrolase [Thaumasiovibrio subtropicus]|uniref:HAD family hydrolase n=1 Tax=Thaumasiovibrio subtropicus TaxID=1891207 RepID=UPI000B358217|nr:HAD family hydrolase [Thaumasiovibrio subtropicus]
MDKHYIFDIDNTVIATEKAMIKSLQYVMKHFANRDYSEADLAFIAPFSAEETLNRLGYPAREDLVQHWIDHVDMFSSHIYFFEGMVQILNQLQQKGIRLGVITSRRRDGLEKEPLWQKIKHLFDVVICAEDSREHKPSPEPMLAYLKGSNATATQCVYFGDTEMDMIAAEKAGFDFYLAGWGAKLNNKTRQANVLMHPKEIISIR